MKRIFLWSLIALLCGRATAQEIHLIFTGRDEVEHRVLLDRITIRNLTQEWEKTLFWPDTTFSMQLPPQTARLEPVELFHLSPNMPNPFNGRTDVTLSVREPGNVLLEISNTNGQLIFRQTFPLESGRHNFRITLSSRGHYILTARHNGATTSIQMVNNENGRTNGIQYTGLVPPSPQPTPQPQTPYPFDYGDLMEFIGYATINGISMESEHVTLFLNNSKTIPLHFAAVQEPFVCGTSLLYDYDRNAYHTLLFGNQCWMKENLKVRHRPNGTNLVTGPPDYQKPLYFIPFDGENYHSDYGYLYEWRHAMNYAQASDNNPSGVQGICPNGWHLPSWPEWVELFEYLESQGQYSCNDSTSFIGKAMATPTGWENDSTECAVGNFPSTNNATGFSAPPAGYHYTDNDYYEYIDVCYQCGTSCWIWSTSNFPDNSGRKSAFVLNYNSPQAAQGGIDGYGCSVRCLKD